jgi:hypothetical protein
VVAVPGAGRGRGVGMLACATTNECGRLRGNGTRPARGSDGGSASATGAIGEADAVGPMGGATEAAADGAGQMVFGAGFAPGGVVAGLDMAIALEMAAIGAGVAAGGGGALDDIATLWPGALWLPAGMVTVAFVGSGGGIGAIFASAEAVPGGASIGIVAVWSGAAATGAADMAWIVGALTGPR